MRHQQEAPRATGGVHDGVLDGRLHDVDDGLDEGARGEVLASAGALVGGALAQQLFVGVALDVGARATPVLLVDEVDDEPLKLGGVLNPVLCLTEDRADNPVLSSEGDEDPAVLKLELVTLRVEQPLPRVPLRQDLLRVEPSRCALMRHLEEQQVGQLLGVFDDTYAIVAKDVAVGPQLVDKST